MSGKLAVKYAFGVNPDPKNSLAYADDHHLVYLCGHLVVVLNLETKEQGFIQLTQNPQQPSLAITAIACCPSKRFIAIAEKSDPVAVVTFYDSGNLRKKKILINPDLGSKEIRTMAFSDDGKFFVTQGSGPEWNLVLWNVEKTPKIIATSKVSLSDDTPVNQISFCPYDQTAIVVFGKSILRVFRYMEGQLRQGSMSVRRDQANFTCHCWLFDGGLVVGNDAGEIFYLENFDFRAVVFPAGNDGEELRPVYSLAPTSRGFVSGHDIGEVKIFEKQEEAKEQYVLEGIYHTPSYLGSSYSGKVLAIAVGGDDNLVLATDTQLLLHFTPSSLQNSKDAKGNVGFDHVFTPFHGPNMRNESTITGLDVALWKPVVVSCGKDRTVRVWNTADKKIELVKEFEDEPNCLTVHPSGTYVAVGFNEKFKIMSVLMDDLCLIKEIPVRFCTVIKFSNGGHFLAAVNASYIQVFHTFTGQLITTLRGHNNKIRNFQWLNADTRLISVGSEGSVYFWDLFPPGRRPEQYTNTMGFSAGVGPKDGSKVFTATSDRMIKEISFARTIDPVSGLEIAIREPRDIEVGTMVSAMLMDDTRSIVLLGTSDEEMPGCILTMQLFSQLSSTYETTVLHSGSVTAMCMSYDGSLIYSSDVHGCLLVSEYEGLGGGGKQQSKATREGTASFEFHDEVVVHRSELDNRKLQILDLTARVEDLTKNNDHQLRLKEMDHANKIRDITLKFSTQLRAETEKYEKLVSEKMQLEEDFQIQTSDLTEKQSRELMAIDNRYRTKLNAESNRHKLMMTETEESHKRWNEENAALIESHQTYIAELTADYEDKLRAEQSSQKKLQHEKETMQIDYETDRLFIEEDADIEISEMKLKYEARLRQEEEMGVELMAQHALVKKNLATLSKEADAQKDEIKRLKDKEARLLDNIRSLEKDIQSHKKEIREREETITDKEKRIFDLKKKNQELEKFRFVLDYKIKELKLQIAPREHEIATMRKQIEEMDLELEQYHKSNEALNLMISELNLKIDGIRREMEYQERRVDINHRLIEKYRRDLQELWEVKEDPHKLKSNVVDLYRVYVQEDMISAAVAASNTVQASSATSGKANRQADSEDPQQLYNRDREQMERSLDSLRRALKTGTMAHKRDLNKMVKDSVILTKELNALRKDAKHLLLQKKAIEQSENSPGVKVGGFGGDMNELMAVLGIELRKPRSSSAKSGKEPADEEEGSPKAPEHHGVRPPATPTSPTQLLKRSHHRTAALRTVSASGVQDDRVSAVTSQYDQWEAWKELDMQAKQMKSLENRLEALCNALCMDANQILLNIDVNLLRGSL